jgi:hypothetical protein
MSNTVFIALRDTGKGKSLDIHIHRGALNISGQLNDGLVIMFLHHIKSFCRTFL